MGRIEDIKTELDTDPLGRGYSTMSDVEASESMNQKDREPDRDSITAQVLVSALVESEYDALPARGKAYLGLIIDAGGCDLNSTTKQQLGTLFPSGSQTRANVAAAIKRTGTRGEEIGVGYVTPSDIADARRLA